MKRTLSAIAIVPLLAASVCSVSAQEEAPIALNDAQIESLSWDSRELAASCPGELKTVAAYGRSDNRAYTLILISKVGTETGDVCLYQGCIVGIKCNELGQACKQAYAAATSFIRRVSGPASCNNSDAPLIQLVNTSALDARQLIAIIQNAITLTSAVGVSSDDDSRPGALSILNLDSLETIHAESKGDEVEIGAVFHRGESRRGLTIRKKADEVSVDLQFVVE